MTPTVENAVAALQRANAELQRQVDQYRAERDEALDQQTASAEVLGVINSSPGELAPVFDTMLEKAMRLGEAVFGMMHTYDGEQFHTAAMRGVPEAYTEYRKQNPPVVSPGTGPARILEGQRVVHIVDLEAEEAYRSPEPVNRALVDLAGARSILTVALHREDALLGMLTIYRQEVRAFSDKQIALLENFAAQAVIAMENARLITETQEALDQQTATAEVLQVINSSPGDLAPVFDAMLEKTMRLCEAAFGGLWMFGDRYVATALRGVPQAYADFLRGSTELPGPGTAAYRFLHGERSIIHNLDLADEEPYRTGQAGRVALVDLGGARTALQVPLCKDETVLGLMTIYRQEVRPFTDKQIALLQNFAAQAVIAIENARLLGELRQRTGDLQQSLEYQTAISDVLKVISGSAFELTPVLQTVVSTAVRLCRADQATIYRLEDGEYRWAADHSLAPEYERIERNVRIRPSIGTLVGRVALNRDTVQILDAWTDPLYEVKEDARVGGVHTMLGVPLLREGLPIGVIGLARRQIEPYTEKEIELVRTFADQAVIAIENARLISETREALDQQTATAEVLGVINSSPGDLQPVFDAMLEKAMRLCEATFGTLWTWDGEFMNAAAVRGASATYTAFLHQGPHPPSPIAHQPLLQGETVVHIDNLAATEGYRSGSHLAQAVVELGSVRTLLAVPLRKDAGLLGVFSIYRDEVRLFTDKQIALLQNFAAQAVIAMENARLLDQIRVARDTAEATLRDLRAAQANLVQAEKMASLGQLTAGIAHEIKNPLNFVNNFASLSVELLDELKETVAPAIAVLDVDKRADLDDTMELLTGNLEKIAEHGKRADGIVKSMLEHSRGTSGERREVDLNNLVEEALNLAYHGARAQDQSFNIVLERDFAPGIALIELAPQDVTRVLLNLFGNGFYAATKHRKEAGDATFFPTLKVTTRDLGDGIEIGVRDNGTGIAPEIKDKLFQPFFTTKPTGEGTGLGLSISYDIITQQHGGTIAVDSEVDAFTEFTVRLPRAYRATTAAAS
jgi:signal transduction histidine kinase